MHGVVPQQPHAAHLPQRGGAQGLEWDRRNDKGFPFQQLMLTYTISSCSTSPSFPHGL